MIPKFRALNIKTGFWFDEQELVFCDGKWFQDWRSFENDFPLDMRDCVVMQSTGLKDKNGVEIFEGDIVQSFSNINRISDPHLTETIEPKYKNKIVIFTNGAFVLSDDGKREYGGVLNHYVGSMVKDLEVIGNIWEDGELLSDSKRTEEN